MGRLTLGKPLAKKKAHPKRVPDRVCQKRLHLFRGVISEETCSKLETKTFTAVVAEGAAHDPKALMLPGLHATSVPAARAASIFAPGVLR